MPILFNMKVGGSKNGSLFVACWILAIAFWAKLSLAQGVGQPRLLPILQVKETLIVYQKADLASPPLIKLEPGIEVKISRRLENGFRRVLLNSPKKVGYVAVKDIQLSVIKEVHLALEDRPTGRPRVQNSWGLSIGMSEITQGTRDFTTSDGTASYSIDTSVATGLAFDLILDYSMSNSFGLRAYGSFKPLEFKGRAQLGSSELDTKVNTWMFGGGFGMKYYISGRIDWWAGLGLEVSKGTKTEIEIGGQTSEGDGASPLHGFLYLSTGAEKLLWGSNFLVTEIRYGQSPFTDPEASAMEAYLGLQRVY